MLTGDNDVIAGLIIGAGIAMKSYSEGLILGIDLGGSKIMSAVATSEGRIVARHRRPTPAQDGPQAVIREIFEAARGTLKDAGITAAQLGGIGIGAPGTSNPDTGVIYTSPNLPGWRDVPLKDIVEREFGVRTVLGNDANAAALGEFCFGGGRGVRNLIYVTISTGIGGGIILDGKLYTGASGAAGEVGHMTIDINGPRCNCGSNGCWEALASGTALAREARRLVEQGEQTSILACAGGDAHRISAETVYAAARDGDQVARGLIARTGYYLGVGFANLVNIFNPELILVGGGLSNIGDMLLEPAMKTVRERAFKAAVEAVRFAPAQLGADAGVLGAVALALQGRKNEVS